MYMAGKNEQYFVNNRIHSKFKTLKGAPWTHTRIGDKESGISGGLYDIKDNGAFLRAYYQHVFVRQNTDYLTEKQLEDGPVVIDLDLRYAAGTAERQHTEEDIQFCIQYYMEVLRKMVEIPEDEQVKVWVMEKPGVNQLEDVTKDGVHIIIGVSVSKQLRIELRDHLLELMKGQPEHEQPMGCVDHTNPLEDIIDGGVAKGGNWQLYGSQKPRHEAYRLTYLYTVTGTDEFESHDVAGYVTADTLKWLSARCEDHPKYPVRPEYEGFMNGRRGNKRKRDDSGELASSGDLNQALDTAENIAARFIDGRESWIKIIWAMRNCGLSQADAASISAKSQKFNDAQDDDKFLEDAWEQPVRTDEGAVGIGTLCHYSRESDPEKHHAIWRPKLPPPTQLCEQVKQSHADQEEIQRKRSLVLPLEAIIKGARCIATVIAPELKAELIYSEEKWWTVNKETNLWFSVKKPSYIIVGTIHMYLDNSIRIKNIESANEEDPERKKQINEQIIDYCKFYKLCDSCSFLSNICDHFAAILRDDEFRNKLDANVGYLAFENGIVNLTTLEFRAGINADDFITRTIPFDYYVPKDEGVEFVRNVIFKICNANEQHLDFYLSAMGYSLLGKAHLEKKMYFLVGQKGDNGKTLILSALSTIAPCYIDKIDRQTFILGYTKAHKHLAATRGKRLVYMEELPTKKLDNEKLKEYADGKSNKNEVLFQTEETIPIISKLWALSNPTPTFDSDGGMEGRYMQMQMNASFKLHHKEDNYETLEFKRDNTLADKLEQKYYMELLYLLMTYAQRYEIEGMPEIPPEWQEGNYFEQRRIPDLVR